MPEHSDLTDWRNADPARGRAELLARIESAKPAVGYELIPMSNVTPRIVHWVWPGHLARGVLAIISGPPDLGKSQIHCFMIAVVTTGGKWPDGTPCPLKGKVAMLTAEDNMADTLHPRLTAAGADLNKVLVRNRIHKDSKDRAFLLQEDIDILEEILRNDPEIVLVTFDPITAFMGGKLDSHRATDVRSQFAPLKDLAERTNVAFSVITHPAKRPGPKAMDHFIGSQAYIAAPRLGDMCCPEFEEGDDNKPKPTGRFLFANVKHNIFGAMPTLAYKLVLTSGGFDPEAKEEIKITRVEWCGESPLSADQAIATANAANKDKPVASVVTFVLDMLAAGPVRRHDIVERAKERGFSEKQLRDVRQKAGILSFKEPHTKETIWWWMTPAQEEAWRKQFKQTGTAE
jgi:hypothetical protein